MDRKEAQDKDSRVGWFLFQCPGFVSKGWCIIKKLENAFLYSECYGEPCLISLGRIFEPFWGGLPILRVSLA